MQPRRGLTHCPGVGACLSCPAVPVSQTSCSRKDQLSYQWYERAEALFQCCVLAPLCFTDEDPPLKLLGFCEAHHSRGGQDGSWEKTQPGRMGAGKKPSRTAQGMVSALRSASSHRTTFSPLQEEGFRSVAAQSWTMGGLHSVSVPQVSWASDSASSLCNSLATKHCCFAWACCGHQHRQGGEPASGGWPARGSGMGELARCQARC